MKLCFQVKRRVRLEDEELEEYIEKEKDKEKEQRASDAAVRR